MNKIVFAGSVSILVVLCAVCMAENPPQDPLARVAAQLNSGDPAQVEQAIAAMPKFITGGNVNYAVKGWAESLLKIKKYSEAEDLALMCILQYASDRDVVESMQAMRVKAALGMNKPAEALAHAKALFNLASMGNTAAALATVSECLEAADPNDAQILRKFKEEQMAGASTQPTDTPRTSEVMKSIKLNAAVYEQKIKENSKLDYGILCAKGNLLLLSDKGKEAHDVFERAYELASDNNLQSATENIARAIKAEDGTIGRANIFVLQVRPKKP